MVQGGLGYLMFYVALFGGVFILSFLGSDSLTVSGDFAEVPALDTGNLTLGSFLLFVFEAVTFFLLLGGLSVFGLPFVYSFLISLALNIGLFYVLARLVRGGG